VKSIGCEGTRTGESARKCESSRPHVYECGYVQQVSADRLYLRRERILLGLRRIAMDDCKLEAFVTRDASAAWIWHLGCSVAPNGLPPEGFTSLRLDLGTETWMAASDGRHPGQLSVPSSVRRLGT